MANEARAQFWQSLSVEGKEARFGLNIAGWTLVVLNLLVALHWMFFFLVVLRAGIVGWLMVNSCACSVCLFVIGLLIGVPALTLAASVPLARYGTGGSFVFGWEG